MVVSRFDSEQNIFYLKEADEAEEKIAVKCNIRITGEINGETVSVNTSLPTINYTIYRFANPFLNAQENLFQLNYSEKTIGLILPWTSIENSDNNQENEFNEFEQAYKYYCIKSIIENYSFNYSSYEQPISFSDLVDKDSIYVILHNSALEENFRLDDCLPSLALKGYYLFPERIKPNYLSLVGDYESDAQLNTLISNRYLIHRDNSSIHIRKAITPLGENTLLSLLYKKLLIENGNALHRFLVLYQVIESFIEKKIREGINEICLRKDQLNNYDFITEINSLNDSRKIINLLFEQLQCAEKNEITNALKDFLVQSNNSYKKQSTGDCFYDIRNLLFHDFKRILESNRDGEINALVLQCETLIHNLVNSVSFNQ